MQNLVNSDNIDKGQKKQKMWKRDVVRSEDHSKMREMMQKLKKFRVAENANSNNLQINNQFSNISNNKKNQGMVGARTSIQQTQGSHNLIKKENPYRKSNLSK